MHENLPICKVNWNNFIKNFKNYIIAWFSFIWLQFVLQLDEEVIAWTYNDLQKIYHIVSDTAKKKNSKIQILRPVW